MKRLYTRLSLSQREHTECITLSFEMPRWSWHFDGFCGFLNNKALTCSCKLNAPSLRKKPRHTPDWGMGSWTPGGCHTFSYEESVSCESWSRETHGPLKQTDDVLMIISWTSPSLTVTFSPQDEKCIRHEDILGEWRCSSTHSLTSTLDGGEWSVSRPGRFTPRERGPGTHWIGGWVGPRAGLDTLV
jgi:hypothetical protein